MTKFLASAAVAALALAASPAAAQTTGAPVGPRVEAILGYDALRVNLEDFGVDEKLKDNDLFYGIGGGVDFAVGTGLSAGVDAEYTTSRNRADFDDGESNVEISTGRDLYAGGRLSMPISPNANVYAKAGYTNLKVNGDVDGIDDSLELDGYRLGAGAQFGIAGKAYVGGEYRYSNYEDDVTRHQLALSVGTRF